MIEKAWRYYLIYKGLNLHYKENSKYDYSKYGPLTKGSDPEKFEVSADRFPFLKLASSFKDEKHYLDYLHWIAWKDGKLPYFRDLSNENDIRNFKNDFLKYKLNITYHFSVFLEQFDVSYLKTNGIDHPKVLDDLFRGDLHLDFYLILDKTFKLTEKYLEIFKNDLLLHDKMNKYKRYRQVSNLVDIEKLYKLILKHMKKDKK
jgi:hypothetical protein